MATKWRKSPDALVAAFDAALPDDPRAERRQMFGYPCAVAGGHMFTGLHQENLVLRLPDDARAELLAQPGAAVFEPMKGRPMREYVVAPPEVVADKKALRRWMKRSLEFAASLPPKQAKARKTKKK